MLLEIMAAARLSQHHFIREMAVDCCLADFGQRSNIRHGGCCDTLALMQLDSRINDLLPCLSLAFGALLQAVGAGWCFHETVCIMEIDIIGKLCAWLFHDTTSIVKLVP